MIIVAPTTMVMKITAPFTMMKTSGLAQCAVVVEGVFNMEHALTKLMMKYLIRKVLAAVLTLDLRISVAFMTTMTSQHLRIAALVEEDCTTMILPSLFLTTTVTTFPEESFHVHF